MKKFMSSVLLSLLLLTSLSYAETIDVRVKQWGDTALDVNSGVKSNGTVRVVMATDQPALTTAMPVATSGWSFQNIAGAATTTVKSGAGVLHAIVINKAVATGVITLYDNTAASGTKIGTITQPAAVLQSQAPLIYDCSFGTGITVVTSAADDITVVYR